MITYIIPLVARWIPIFTNYVIYIFALGIVIMIFKLIAYFVYLR